MRRALPLYAAVAAGGALGALARWGVGAMPLADLGGGFAFGTLFANVTGSFLIGVLATLSAPGGRLALDERVRHFLLPGLCGGYTTFSIFSLETILLLEAGRYALAVASVALSLALWLAAVWAGAALAIRINRPKGG